MDERTIEQPPTQEAVEELTDGKEEGRDGIEAEREEHPEP